MPDLPNQIVFVGKKHGYHPDGTFTERVIVRGLGRPLPPGMHAWYDIEQKADGSTWIEGVIQARSKHGRRYVACSDESAMQARLLKWSARILRELTKEQA